MSSFSGKAAKEAKQYFGELHLTILESFRGLFDDLEGNLQQHIDTFGSDVDGSDSAIIKSNYLQEVKEDINEVFEDLEKQDEIIHDTIKEVSDTSSATPPSFSDVDEWKKKAIKKLTELDEDLSSFTSVGDETDVKEFMHQIETVMSNAKTSEGKARFADFEGSSQGSELAKLQGYNADKKEEQMKKAKDIKESTIKDLNKTSSKDIVNKAYQEFKDEDLTYYQYTAIVIRSKIQVKPLFNNKGTIGYFDYGSCLFPNGQVDQKTYFFNSFDIEKIFFEGYVEFNIRN